MSESPRPGDANPLSQGADPNSVETAAADFSAMLQDEGRHDRREARSKTREARPSPAPEADGPESGDDGQPQRQPARERREPADDDARSNDLHDPLLDGEREREPDGEEDEDEDRSEDDDREDDEDGDEDEDDGDFAKSEHEVTVNGETVKVTGAELLAGYSREADYRQKSERNAREYEEIEAFASESVEARQRVDATARDALALLQALQPTQADWDTMERDNPQGYIAAKKHWDALQGEATKLRGNMRALFEDHSKHAVKRDEKYFRDQETALINKMPALRDPKNAEHFRKTVLEYGKSAGYTEEELKTGAVDHRDLMTLYKAAMYDRTRASISAAGKKGREKAPRQSESRAAQPRTPARERRTRLSEADRRLARTGSVQDAAGAFAEMIRGESR